MTIYIFSVLWVLGFLGIFTLCSFLAAWILERRKKKLLDEKILSCLRGCKAELEFLGIPAKVGRSVDFFHLAFKWEGRPDFHLICYPDWDCIHISSTTTCQKTIRCKKFDELHEYISKAITKYIKGSCNG